MRPKIHEPSADRAHSTVQCSKLEGSCQSRRSLTLCYRRLPHVFIQKPSPIILFPFFPHQTRQGRGRQIHPSPTGYAQTPPPSLSIRLSAQSLGFLVPLPCFSSLFFCFSKQTPFPISRPPVVPFPTPALPRGFADKSLTSNPSLPSPCFLVASRLGTSLLHHASRTIHPIARIPTPLLPRQVASARTRYRLFANSLRVA